jgi:hypothetical protein
MVALVDLICSLGMKGKYIDYPVIFCDGLTDRKSMDDFSLSKSGEGIPT